MKDLNVNATVTSPKAFIEVGPAAIDIKRSLQEISGSEIGGQCLFVGTVRHRNHGKNVIAVAYDAAPELAESVLQEICDEARLRWGKHLRFSVRHRTGRLLVGDASVAIAVGSVHRDESYQASRYVIEELKKRAPIWKKEFYDNGETEWLKGHALCDHSHGSAQEDGVGAF